MCMRVCMCACVRACVYAELPVELGILLQSSHSESVNLELSCPSSLLTCTHTATIFGLGEVASWTFIIYCIHCFDIGLCHCS